MRRPRAPEHTEAPAGGATSPRANEAARPYSALSSSVISLTEDFASPNSMAVLSA